MRRIAKSWIRWGLIYLLSASALAQQIAVPADSPPGTYGLLKAGQLTKAGSALVDAWSQFRLHRALGRSPATFAPRNPLLSYADGRILVNVRAAGDTATLRADLEQLGLSDAAEAGSIVSGLLPLAALEDAVALSNLRAISAATRPVLSAGSITSQGDLALRAQAARDTLSVDGTGVTVGVLSDAYNTLGGAAADIASGDLPAAGVEVLNGESSYCGVLILCIDEGRAMLQIVHDIAPGASLKFHHGLGGKAGYANAILSLRDAGADVIVDDLMYLDEPMFQDGVVAQAVDTVVASGTAYFSAAGNSGRKSYEAPFDDSGIVFCIEFFYPLGDCDPIYERVGRMHDFDPGPGVDVYQNITVPADTVLNVALQWDEPFGGQGPGNDHDIVLVDASGGVYFAISANDNVTTREGWEVLQFENAAVLGHGEKFALIITYDDVDSQEPPATLLKTVIFGAASFDEYQTASSTLMGHANAAGANAVGAAFFAETPEFGVTPPQPETYSSAGGTPILFNTNGTARTASEIRSKPEITAVDGVNTTFFFNDSYGNDGIDDFFGTSAAAPHAAAVAALLLDAQPTASPEQIRNALQSSAIDMASPGFDFDTGAGLIRADAAVSALLSAGGNIPPAANFDFSTSALQVDFTDGSSDADGNIVSWSWDFGDGLASTAQNPTHTYATGGSYTVQLTVVDNDGSSNASSQSISVSAGGSTTPVAAFAYDCTNRNCQFDGGLSSNEADTWLWNFGDGNTATTTVATIDHQFGSQGTYTVSLVVLANGTESTPATGSLRIRNRGTLSGTVFGQSGGGSGTGGDTTASEKGRKKCTDGIDNDGDGLVDAADPDCQ